MCVNILNTRKENCFGACDIKNKSNNRQSIFQILLLLKIEKMKKHLQANNTFAMF